MPSLDTILTVTLAGVLLSLSPGPSMLYVLSRSVGQSRAAGLASALGLAIGGVVLAVVAASGLAVLFQTSLALYQSVTILGSLYIIYLGGQMAREALSAPQNSEAIQLERVDQEAFARIVTQGVLVELLNPKTILFFMAFIPPFVDPTRGDVTAQLLILGMLVPLTALPSDLIVATVGGQLAERIRGERRRAQVLNLLGAVTLIGIGLSMLGGLEISGLK